MPVWFNKNKLEDDVITYVSKRKKQDWVILKPYTNIDCVLHAQLHKLPQRKVFKFNVPWLGNYVRCYSSDSVRELSHKVSINGLPLIN